MKRNPAIILLVMPLALGLASAALLASVWRSGLPEGSIPLRIPIDRSDAEGEAGAGSPFEKANLVTSDGTAADLPGAWPGFRGPLRDGRSNEDTPLAETWAAGEPKAIWSVDAGEGHAGAAVLNGRVYLMDYDRVAQADALRCLSLADGREIWRFSYPLSVKRNKRGSSPLR